MRKAGWAIAVNPLGQAWAVFPAPCLVPVGEDSDRRRFGKSAALVLCAPSWASQALGTDFAPQLRKKFLWRR